MSVQTNVSYGFSQPLILDAPFPIVGNRAPTANDINQALGTVWVYPSINGAWILTSVVNNAATWSDVSGGTGMFTTITATGNITSTGGNISATIGNVHAGAIVSAGTSITAGTTVTAGTGITATTGNIVASTGNITATLGNIAATAGSLSAGTTVTAGTGLTVTVGDATVTNGNVVMSTATNHIVLPGPIKIMSGAGAPAAGLATEAGDMYIRTDPAGATSRIYVATAAATWTNVTCAG